MQIFDQFSLTIHATLTSIAIVDLSVCLAQNISTDELHHVHETSIITWSNRLALERNGATDCAAVANYDPLDACVPRDRP